jgi:exonuclease SbcC
MKIRLINFRCYEDETFDFGDDGLVLISACSGAGKTTILMGIYFALYGYGTKVAANGKTSCKVELEFDDLKIVRTKRPNRLVLNDIYEDDEAQKIINERFGDVFDVTGYISQNALNSFILKSPSDKLEFLEQFAFKDVNLIEIKNRSKVLITQRNEELNKTLTELQLTTEVFNNLDCPEEIKYPFKKSKYDYETLVKNEHLKIRKCDLLIKKSRNELEKLQKELNEFMVLKTLLNEKEENIDSLNKKLEDICTEEEKNKYKGDSILEEYKKTLESILSKKELLSLENKLSNDKEQIKEMKELEIINFNTELEKINKTLWKEYTEEELITTIKDLKDSLQDVKKITFLKGELSDCNIDGVNIDTKKETLNNLRNELSEKQTILENIKKQKTIYSCPGCNNKLNFKENRLYLVNDLPEIPDVDIDFIKKEISVCEKSIKKLEAEIPDQESKLKRKNKLEDDISKIQSKYEEELEEESILEDLGYLEKYYSSERIKEKQKTVIENNIKNNNFSSSYKIFEKELLKLETRIEELKEDYDSDNCKEETEYTEEELRTIIKQEESNKECLNRLKKNKKVLENEKHTIEKQIEDSKKKYMNKYENIRDTNDIENSITENKNIIEEQENKKTTTNVTIENIKKYDEYVIAKSNFEKWNSKLQTLKEREKEERDKYSAALLLKEKILEAESIAVSNIIESINTHAQIYLDSFFIDNPMIVRLLAFKETKKASKPQINIEIDYKGMECDLNSLSGGELSRVVLAFTLALAEMFNTPILLLDESTASLDQDTTTIIFDSIKENFKDRMVIIIAHQVVEGVFDKIIKL